MRRNRCADGREESVIVIRSSVGIFWKLAKVPLCLLISFSAGFGAMLAGSTSLYDVFYISLSVFLLAMGGATINSAQEVATDGEMSRTADRPLVRKQISRTFACVLAILFIVLALIMLSRVKNPVTAVSLGVLALFLYNAVYTPLKRTSLFAIFPGAVCGAIPPLIGFIAGSGQLLSYTSALLFMLLFLWQVPHFCLVLLRYRNEYLQSNLPNFLKILSEKGVKQLSCVWICGLALVMMLFSVTGGISYSTLKILVLLNALIMVIVTVYNLILRDSPAYSSLFMCLNSILLIHMIIVGFGNYSL